MMPSTSTNYTLSARSESRNYRIMSHTTDGKFAKLRPKLFKRPSKYEIYLSFVLSMLMGFMYSLINLESRQDFYYMSPRRTLSVPSDEKLLDIDLSDNGDGPTFVFVMGTEGTGHHLINSLLAQSPNMKKMKQIGVCASGTGELHTLSSQFFSTRNEGRLFNPNKRQREELDASQHYATIVDTLQSIRTKFNDMQIQEQHINESKSSAKATFHIAINANSCGRPTMMSYPNLPGPDRPLQNFNLDIFYNACNDAHVKCKHIYIYRDPYDVIKSTTINRAHNSNIYDAIRLYTSVMQQIHSQMISHLDRNLGCFGFLDAKGYQLEQDWERFGMLFGWTSFDSFVTHAKSVQKKDAPTPMSDEMKMKLIPARLSVLMRAFEDVHKRVNDLCYSSLQQLMVVKSIEEERALATNNNELVDPMTEETAVEETTEEMNKENDAAIDTKEINPGNRGMTDEKVQFLDNIITSL